MASGIFAVLDDIAMLMDDVAITSKIAVRKTAGILGDDLAVNAEKATGFVASRELPVLWAIIKGSFFNKLIIIPIAIALNVFLPIAIKIILVIGGIYLAFEGVEKVLHALLHKKENPSITIDKNMPDDSGPNEKEKIKSAVITDFILSVEIVIIALSTVLEQSIGIQILTVCIVSFIATIGVYGIVAFFVRLDDIGYKIIQLADGKGWKNSVGQLLVNMLPYIIKTLSIIGTIALLLVSGGIFVHNIEFIHHAIPTWIPSILGEFLVGILVGVVAVSFWSLFRWIFVRKKSIEKHF